MQPARSAYDPIQAAETIMAPIKGRYKSRTGSTRTASPGWINADREKNIKLNEIESFTYLKVNLNFRSKMGQIKKDLRSFSASCCVVKPPFCILSASSTRTRLVFIHP